MVEQNSIASLPFNKKRSSSFSVKDFKGLGARYFATLSKKLDYICQVDGVKGTTETNGSVKNRAIRLANGLVNKGLKPKDVVLVCSRCHCDQTIVVLAALFVGLAVAPVDQELAYTDYADFVTRIRPVMAFCDLRALTLIEKIVGDFKMNCEIYLFEKSHPDKPVFSKLLVQDGDIAGFSPMEITDPKSSVAFMMHTQGTVSGYKFVCISHQNILYQSLRLLKFIEMPQKIMSCFPLAWILEVVLMCSSFEYPVTRILPGTFVPRTSCKLMHDLDVQYVFLPTNYAKQIVSDVALKDYNLSSLKCIFFGSSTTPAQEVSLMRQYLPKVKFIQFYAMTEACCIAVTPLREYDLSLDHPDTSGKVLPGVKLKVVDVDTREDLGLNTVGELLVAGDGVMMGYFHGPSTALSVMEKHYLKTGDIGRIDDDGWVYVQGRIDNIIYHQNEKIYPSPIEASITLHPFVQDAVVIGDKDNLIVCVVAVPKTNLTLPSMERYMQERTELKPTKIIIFESFPKTSLGNIKKGCVRDEVLKVRIVYTHSVPTVLPHSMSANKCT